MPFGEQTAIIGDVMEKRSYGARFLMEVESLARWRTGEHQRSGEVNNFGSYVEDLSPISIPLLEMPSVMSSRANIGGLGNSLPSWISNHLGYKSYMADKVNQLPSSFLEESPHQDEPFDHGGSEVRQDCGQGIPQQCQGVEKEVLLHLKGRLGIFSEYISGGRSSSGPRSRSTPRMAYNGRDNAEDKSVDGTVVVAGDEVSLITLEMNAFELRLLGGKVRDPILGLEPFSSSSSSSSKLDGWPDLRLPSELRSDGQGNHVTHRSQKKAMWKFVEPPSKEVNKAASKVVVGEGTSAKPIAALGPRATMLRNSTTTKKLLEAVIPPFDKEEAEKLELNQVISKFFHIIGQAVMVRSSLASYSQEMKDEVTIQQDRATSLEGEAKDDWEAITEKLAKLEVVVVKLRNNEARSKKLAIESSEDFQEAVKAATSKYFGEGFNFYKRLIAYHHPDLGIEVQIDLTGCIIFSVDSCSSWSTPSMSPSIFGSSW
ncbi:hypothetical protein Acr_00g0033590 [Actinidia rufa]|uniref:Uncharacterized protein n=1 Tax=Actinidia rufa TaxID=165716 RepID=A0A7J0DFQ0_9ERIC|nr:hypothetical protein Acr_00g0033590 [Actinidia rufa]